MSPSPTEQVLGLARFVVFFDRHIAGDWGLSKMYHYYCNWYDVFALLKPMRHETNPNTLCPSAEEGSNCKSYLSQTEDWCTLQIEPVFIEAGHGGLSLLYGPLKEQLFVYLLCTYVYIFGGQFVRGRVQATSDQPKVRRRKNRTRCRRSIWNT